MNINEIVELSKEFISEQKMIYARRVGTYGEANYGLMNRFKNWASESGLMNNDATILGIALDNPAITPPDECRYDVCLLGEYESCENWIETGVFHGGNYAVLSIPHTVEAVACVWQEGVAYVLSKGFLPDETRPFVERYVKRKVDQIICEFLIPIQ